MVSCYETFHSIHARFTFWTILTFIVHIAISRRNRSLIIDAGIQTIACAGANDSFIVSAGTRPIARQASNVAHVVDTYRNIVIAGIN